MKQKKQKISFDEYYHQIYGERWDALKRAFKEEKEPILLSDKLKVPYFLDSASLTAASILPITPSLRVLDMCAAPGGKTLSIALRLDGIGELVANDRSPERRARLKNVIDSSLDERLKSIIKIKGYDASSWCLYEKEAYDRVLLDAPCSSERHVFNDEKHLSLWSPSRPKRLSSEQFALLSSALIVLKKGGYLLYSTCSINPSENEGVVNKLFLRHPDEIEEINVNAEGSESLERGCIILPDKNNGLGPMYFCLIRKKE